jgi:hypothetical protein
VTGITLHGVFPPGRTIKLSPGLLGNFGLETGAGAARALPQRDNGLKTFFDYRWTRFCSGRPYLALTAAFMVAAVARAHTNTAVAYFAKLSICIERAMISHSNGSLFATMINEDITGYLEKEDLYWSAASRATLSTLQYGKATYHSRYTS